MTTFHVYRLFIEIFNTYFRQDFKIYFNIFILSLSLELYNFSNNDFFNFSIIFFVSIEIVIINIVFNKIITEH